MYVLMNHHGQYWGGLEWDIDISQAERYATEELSDEDAFDILDEWGIAAHVVEVDDDDNKESAHEQLSWQDIRHDLPTNRRRSRYPPHLHQRTGDGSWRETDRRLGILDVLWPFILKG